MAAEPTIEQRLALLEQAVAQIQRQLSVSGAAGAAMVQARGTAPAPSPGASAAAPAGAAPAAVSAAAPAPGQGLPAGPGQPPAAASPRPPTPPRDWAAISQLWIGRAGIALLMLGLAFLFRYAVVRGWLTPILRVGFGLVVGATLLGLGWRLSRAGGRRAYGLLLMGGGLGVLYLSAYAAFAFYALVSAAVAIGALALLALLALLLAADRDEVLLALLGALGAFAAPLLVRTPHPSIPLFCAYVVLVSAWAGWTALREGWRSLGWTVALAAIVLLVLAAGGSHPRAEEVWLTAAFGVCLLGLAAALLWREHAASGPGSAWKRRPVPRWLRTGWGTPGGRTLTAEGLDLASVGWLTALATLAFPVYASGALRMLPAVAGATAFAEAALLGAAAWAWRKDERLARALALAGVVPLVAGTFLLQLRDYRGLLALEALGLLALARRASDPRLRNVAHAIFAFVALVYFVFLSPPIHGAGAVVILWDAAMVAAGFAALAFLFPPQPARRIYGIGALLALLAWLYVTLHPLAGGAYWVDLSWVALGSGLLLGAWLRGYDDLRWGGLIVLGILAARLLLVDAKALPPGGRIVVFLAVGAVFLVLGALYRRRLLAHGPHAPHPGDGAPPPTG